MSRTKGLIAAAAAISALAIVPAANAASGSGGQLVSGTVVSAISVVGAPVTLTGFTPGAGAPATGSGDVTVVSTDAYCLSVADATNAGKMKDLLGDATANALQWKTADASALAAANAFRPLGASLGVAGTAGSGVPTTLGKLWAIDYSIDLSSDNLPAGLYTTTATFTATTC